MALEIVRGGFDRLTNFSLCHGTAGNADLMLFAAEILQDESWKAAAELAAQAGLQRYDQPRALWPSGMLRAQETPDLMWGTAGIAYFYLRLATSGIFPTVLLPCASWLPGYLPSVEKKDAPLTVGREGSWISLECCVVPPACLPFGTRAA